MARYKPDCSVVTYQWASGGTIRQVQDMDPEAVAQDPTLSLIAASIRGHKQAHMLAYAKVSYCAASVCLLVFISFCSSLPN
jgi:hypothetical protein